MHTYENLSNKKLEPLESKLFLSENVVTATVKLWVLKMFFSFSHSHVSAMCVGSCTSVCACLWRARPKLEALLTVLPP